MFSKCFWMRPHCGKTVQKEEPDSRSSLFTVLEREPLPRLGPLPDSLGPQRGVLFIIMFLYHPLGGPQSCESLWWRDLASTGGGGPTETKSREGGLLEGGGAWGRWEQGTWRRVLKVGQLPHVGAEL